MSRSKLIKQGFKPLNEVIWNQLRNANNFYDETLYQIGSAHAKGNNALSNDDFNKIKFSDKKENAWDQLWLKNLFTNADLRSFSACGERIYGLDKNVYEEITSCNNLCLMPEELNTKPIACMPFPSYMIWFHEPIDLLGNLHVFPMELKVNGEKPNFIRKFNGFIVTYVPVCKMSKYGNDLGIDFGPKNFKGNNSVYFSNEEIQNGNLCSLDFINKNIIFTKLAKEKLKYTTTIKDKQKNDLEGYLSISFVSNEYANISDENTVSRLQINDHLHLQINDHLLVPIVKGIPFDQLADIAFKTHILEEKLSEPIKNKRVQLPEGTWLRKKNQVLGRLKLMPPGSTFGPADIGSVIEIFEQDWMEKDCYFYTKALNIVIGAIAQLSHFPNYVDKKSKAIENIDAGTSKKNKKQKTTIHALTSTVPLNPSTNKKGFLKGITCFKVKPHIRKSSYRRQPHGDKWRKENPGEQEFTFSDGRTYHMVRIPWVKVNGPKRKKEN